MRVHPEIAALRGNRAPQCLAQQAMKQACDNWRAEPGVSQALAEIERIGAGAGLASCPALEAIFTGCGEAEAMMDSLARHFCRAIAANPLGHPPFRNGHDGRASTLLLARHGTAQLLLHAREPGSYDFPCLTVTDALRYDAVVAGEASARILRLAGPRAQVCIDEERVALVRGARLAFDCTSEALLVDTVRTRIVILRLVRGAARPQPGREYCLESGRLLHQSAGMLATSRREMMTALLGRMGRSDAAPVLAGLALRPGEDSLRWQALREALALDSASGFAALCTIARDPVDSLADAAGALRAQLLEAFPQLAQVEAARCPE